MTEVVEGALGTVHSYRIEIDFLKKTVNCGKLNEKSTKGFEICKIQQLFTVTLIIGH